MLINFKSLLVVISLGGVFCILNAANAANVERIFSPSGIEIWYVQEPSIPVISLSIGFSGGSALDPKNKQGLARLAVALLDEGAGDLDDKNFQSAV